MEFVRGTSSADGRFRITLAGELDIQSVDQLDAAIALAASSTDRRVEVDMSEVQFIDSSGLRGLIRAFKRFDSDGKQLRIIDPSDPVTRLLKLTGQFERFTAS